MAGNPIMGLGLADMSSPVSGASAQMTNNAVPQQQQAPTSHAVTVSVTPTIPTSPSSQQLPTSPQISAPAPSNTNPHINPSTGAWDDNYYASQQQQQQPDFNSIYQPQLDALNAQRDNLQNTVLPSQIGQVNTAATQASGDIDTQTGQYNQQYQQDQNLLGQNSNSAYSQAQQQYNQLYQRNLAMYGAGSSAGPAMNALLGQQYEQTTGNVGQSYAQALSGLLTQHNQYLLWANQQKSDIQSQAQNSISQIHDQFDQALQGINNNEAMVESQKSAAKQQYLQNAIQQIQNINQYAAQKAIDLQSWQQQMQTAMGQQANTIAQQHASFLASNPFANTNQINETTPQQQRSQSYLPPFLGQQAGSNNTDQIQSLINGI